jgi:hypothetical protein
MLKRIVLIIAALLISPLIWGQVQQVIASGGNAHKNSSGVISWTLGELVIETFKNETGIITQGFQQSRLKVSSVDNILSGSIIITAYPNPAQDFLYIKTESEIKGLRYSVVDVNGKEVSKGNLTANPMELNFMHLPSATYVVRIMQGTKQVAVVRVVKY